MKKFLILAFIATLTLTSCGKTEVNNTDTIGKNNSENVIDNNSETPVVDGEELSENEGEKLIEETFTKGGKLTCSMEVNEEGMKTSGIMYLNGDKNEFYGEMEINMFGTDMKMFILRKGDYDYQWNSMNNEGTKFLIEEDEDDYSFLDDEGEYEDDEGVKYNCKKGIPSNIKFEIPKNIEFSEDDYDMGIDFDMFDENY